MGSLNWSAIGPKTITQDEGAQWGLLVETLKAMSAKHEVVKSMLEQGNQMSQTWKPCSR